MSTTVVNQQITDVKLPTNWVAPKKPPYREVINKAKNCTLLFIMT